MNHEGTTHWEGCEQAHHDCALAKLAARDKEIADIRAAMYLAKEVIAAKDKELERANKLLTECESYFAWKKVKGGLMAKIRDALHPAEEQKEGES